MKRFLPFLLLIAGCGGEAPAPEPAAYDRIISIVPSATEMLFAAGAGKQVVGVTRYCTYPPGVEKIEKIGALELNYERILELRPDVVVTRETMTSKNNEELRKLGIPVLELRAENFEQIAAELRRLGRLTGHEATADAAADDLLRRVEEVEASIPEGDGPTVYIELTPDPVGTAGPDSYAGDCIRRAGGRNIMQDLGWPWGEIAWEVVLERDPDFILVVHEQTDGLEQRPGWAGLSAVKNGRVHVVPKGEFLYPTPRLVRGLERAAKLLHETP